MAAIVFGTGGLDPPAYRFAHWCEGCRILEVAA